MILKANGKYIDMSAVRHLLAVGEKNADFLTFEVSKNYHGVDLSDCIFTLRAVNPAGNLAEQTLRKRIDGDRIFLTWTVDGYFTAVSGVLKLEIRGAKNDELVIKYDLSDIFVRESAVGEGLPEIPDITVIQGEKGDDGLSAYEIAVNHGFSGNENEWLESLKGADGRDGNDGKDGEKGDTGERGLQGIQGEKGDAGADGKNGLSAYEIAVKSGFSGTENEWLESLKGADGRDGNDGKDGEKGDTGERGLQGIQGEKGDAGADGKNGLSAYEIAVKSGFSGNESEWLESLKGADGRDGNDGKDGEKGDTGERGLQGIQGEKGDAGADGKNGLSAYEIAVKSGFSGNESEWLESLKGEKGEVNEQEILEIKKRLAVLESKSGGSAVTEKTILDTGGFTEKSDTIAAYGENILIYESSASAFSTLSDTVEKWGGINSQNNYISDNSGKFGINMSNWSEQDCTTAILFADVLNIFSGRLIFTINAALSTWMNQKLSFKLINAENVQEATEKAISGDSAYIAEITIAGNQTKNDVMFLFGEVTGGNYFLYIDGTKKADNSNFTYNKITLLNY